MQEIMAVFHIHWSSELIKSIVIIIACSFWIVFVPLQLFLQIKQRNKRYKENEERERRWREKYELKYELVFLPDGMSVYREKIKRRKDHPLTTIFRNEMPVRQ